MATKRSRKSGNAAQAASLSVPQQEEVNKAFALAIDLHQQGNLQQAEALYKEIIEIQPRHADAYHMLGAMAQQIGQSEAACELIQQAIHLNKRVAHYHYNLAVAHQALGELPQAAKAYQRAIQLQPDYLSACENLSVVFRDLGQVDAAIAMCQRALAINNNSLVANQNMGTLLYGRGQRKSALSHLDKVLAINPAYTEAHWMKALVLLSQGQYRQGWREYEWRFFTDTFDHAHIQRVVPFPKWDGSTLTGKQILITPEQGVGDEILFASCFADVIEQTQHCVIECDPRLQRLFERTFPQARVMAADRLKNVCWNASMPLFDFRISAGSLPGILRREKHDFPQRPSFLKADEALKKKWRHTLSTLKNPLNIGISWRGGKDTWQQRNRSIPLEFWTSVFRHDGINFINLQYGNHSEEIEKFNRLGPGYLHTLEGIDAQKNLEDFSALISALDLVISVDNSTVHLAGALGTPTWVLLPCGAAWAWQNEGERCDWYDSIRLFRQCKPGIKAWQQLLTQVGAEMGRQQQNKRSPHHEGASPPQVKSDHPPYHPPRTARTALLLNDTSFWYHWGCSCTSLAIHAQLRQTWEVVTSLPIDKTRQLQALPDTLDAFDDSDCFARFNQCHPDIVAQLNSADVIYINGEGTLHGLSDQSIGLLYLIWIAKTRLSKQVHLINHSCYPEDSTHVSDTPAYQLYKKIYQSLDSVSIRETQSQTVVSKMGISSRLSFDCLPLFIDRYFTPTPRPENKNIVIAGSVAWGRKTTQAFATFLKKISAEGYSPILLIGANAHLAADDVQFVETLQQSIPGCFELRLATSELEWLNTIADARLLVSGRFHHSIAAAFLGTPFLVLESNTPKIDGMMEMFSLHSRASATDPELANTLYQTALKIIHSPDDYVLNSTLKTELTSLALRNFSTDIL